MTAQMEQSEKILSADNKCNGPAQNTGTDSGCKWLKENFRRAWDFRSKLTVEPFILCYILPSVLAGLAVQNLCFEKACLVTLQYNETTCKNIMRGATDHYGTQHEHVHDVVSKMTAWSSPMQTAIPGILALFLGAWSDRTGKRKPLMIFPIIGKFLSAVGLILSTVYMLNVGLNETAIIEGLPPALAGGRVAVSMATYSYVTDITTESERTFRLGIITAIFTLSRPIGLALSGYMVNRYGYYGVFSVACVFFFTGLVYISLRLKNKSRTTVESAKRKNCLSIFSFKYFVETINVAFKKRIYYRRMQLFLILLAYILIVGPVISEAQTAYWFMRYKFKYTEVDLSIFSTYSAIIGIAGSFVTTYIFSKRWNMDDCVIGVIACMSRISASLVYAFAPTTSVFYLGPVLDMFSSSAGASLRSIATKLVNKHETGKTNSLISIADSLMSVVFSPIQSKLYRTNLIQFAGAFYLVSATVAVPAFAILIILYQLRKWEKCEEDSENTKEESSQIFKTNDKIDHVL